MWQLLLSKHPGVAFVATKTPTLISFSQWLESSYAERGQGQISCSDYNAVEVIVVMYIAVK